MMLAPLLANAQDTVYIGGSGRTGVELNLDVLDTLPPAPAAPGPRLLPPVLDPGESGPIRLRPPHQVSVEPAPRPLRRPMEPRVAPREPATVRAAPQDPVNIRKRDEPAAAEPAMSKPARAEPAKTEPALTRPATVDRTIVDRAVEDSPAAPRAEPVRQEAPERSLTRAEPPATVAVREPARPKEPERPVSPTVREPVAPPEPVARSETGEMSEMGSAADGPSVASLGDVPRVPGDKMQLPFAPGGSDLPAGAEAALGAVGGLLEADPELRVQLKAYAGGDSESASQARRLSLSRALAVRSFFIEQGVRSTRIDVRALGNRNEDGPSDRVDVILMKR